MKTGVETKFSAIAIAQEENVLKAVELEKRGDAFEVLWTKSGEISDGDWRDFVVGCGLSVGPLERTQVAGNRVLVVGFDSAGVGFYRINVPAAGEEEIASIVKLQAEALLPLSAEQMELAWRTGQVRNGEVTVTIAAARRDRLQRFVSNVEVFQPGKILLSSEAIVKVWRTFFSGNDKTSVIVNLSARSTQVCLAEGERLSNAVTLDMGIEDIVMPDGLAEQTQDSERFAQDMRSVLELFGCAAPAEVPVFVLSDGSSSIEMVISCLKSAGLKAEAAMTGVKEPKKGVGLAAEDIYEYRVPIGLGLCALDDERDELNIFEHLYEPKAVEEKKHWLYSPKVTGAIAAATLVVLLLVSYVVDVASPEAIERRLQASNVSADIGLLEERQKLMKVVAQQRPDLLELLNLVTLSGENGIMLDSLHFKKGQPININGQAQSSEQIYKFQENLLKQKNIKEVKIQSASKDNRGDQIKFTMTFHYKNFTRKGRK